MNYLLEAMGGFLNMITDNGKIVKKLSGTNSGRELQQDKKALEVVWYLADEIQYKCKVMETGRNRRPDFEYPLEGGVKLAESHCEKNLGVCVTPDPFLEGHIFAIVKSVNPCLWTLG